MILTKPPFFFQAIQIIIGALILCLSASVLQIHEVHFTGDVALFLIVVIQVSSEQDTPPVTPVGT